MQKEKLDLVVSIIAVSLFMLMLVVAGVLFFRIYLKRKNTLILEREMMKVQFEQKLLRSQLEIQEQTFTDISRELHDNIGQVLSLVRINLNTLEPSHDSNKINSMDELMGKALTDLRNLSHSLDADHIRHKGWILPAKRLFQDIQSTGRYKVRVDIDDNLPRLGTEKQIIVYRMLQEIVNNIIRHASATAISIEAKKRSGILDIIIQDNGKGFDTGSEQGGAGLRNLANRSKLINADLVINSEPGNGTSVTISIKPENLEQKDNQNSAG